MLCGMFSKLTTKTQERRQLTFISSEVIRKSKVNWRRSGVFIVNFENMPHSIHYINLFSLFIRNFEYVFSLPGSFFIIR